MIVFLLSGLWHGAEWSFVFWGMLHGSLMIVEKVIKDLGIGFQSMNKKLEKLVDVVRWIVTFILINITWVFFRAGSVEKAVMMIKRIFSGGWQIQESIVSIFEKLIEVRVLKRFVAGGLLEKNHTVTIWLIMAILVLAVVFLKNAKEKMMSDKYNWSRSLLTVILLVWCVVSLSDVSEFLYFNF